MYMSYCRHEGTLHELRGCISDVQEHIDGEAEYTVSEQEISCFKMMVEEFWSFLDENSLIDIDGGLDVDKLDEICEAMAKKAEETWCVIDQGRIIFAGSEEECGEIVAEDETGTLEMYPEWKAEGEVL